MTKDGSPNRPAKDRRPWSKSKPRGGGYGKPAGGRGGAPEPIDDGIVRLFGVHAVEAALANPRRQVLKLYATENGERRLAEAIAAKGVGVERVTPHDLDRKLGADTVHQGLLLETEPLEELTIDDLAEAAHDTGAPLVILDHVTDPHNVGAVLRSAAVFGAVGLVMTRRHSPPLNGVLAKSASGALDLVPVVTVQNLAKTLEELKGAGFSLLGLDGEAEGLLEDEPFDGPTAIVLGAEGKGLRELTRLTCEKLVRISAAGPLKSLNVSNAAAVALHWAAHRRST